MNERNDSGELEQALQFTPGATSPLGGAPAEDAPAAHHEQPSTRSLNEQLADSIDLLMRAARLCVPLEPQLEDAAERALTRLEQLQAHTLPGRSSEARSDELDALTRSVANELRVSLERVTSAVNSMLGAR